MTKTIAMKKYHSQFIKNHTPHHHHEHECDF